jgi:hypothetical protein
MTFALEAHEDRIVQTARERPRAEPRRKRRRDDERPLEILGREIEIEFVVLADQGDEPGLDLGAFQEGGIGLRGRRRAVKDGLDRGRQGRRSAGRGLGCRRDHRLGSLRGVLGANRRGLHRRQDGGRE